VALGVCGRRRSQGWCYRLLKEVFLDTMHLLRHNNIPPRFVCTTIFCFVNLQQQEQFD